MSGSASAPPANPVGPKGVTRSELIFKSANNLMKHFSELDSQAREVNQSLRDNRLVKERHLSHLSLIRSKFTAQVTNAGFQVSNCATAERLARRASEVFDDPKHLKSARVSYDFVMSIGGIDKLDEYKKKSDAIQDRKLDDSLLEYTEVLDKYKMGIGSVIMMVWSCGSKSFVRVVEQLSDSTLSTLIRLRILVNSKDGKAMHTVVPITIINQNCVVASGANLQKLFDQVCEGDNIKKLYDLHVETTQIRSRYPEHEFSRAVVQKSRDGIEESPGLTNIIVPCGSLNPSMSNQQGNMPIDASSLKMLAAASQAMVDDESDDESDEEPMFLKERTREERDRQGKLDAIFIE